MKLTNNNLKELCKIAIMAAKEAGQIINEFVDKNVTVNNKEGADSLASQVVTEVDIKAQEIILKILEDTIQNFDLALLTEESVDDKSRLEKDYFWCIDPMDGTLAFTEQKPGYAVSIALVSKSGEPNIGVVFDPLTNTLYYAIKGLGAYKNEKKWNPNLSFNNSNSFSFYVDRSYMQHKNFQIVVSEITSYAKSIGKDKFRIIENAGAVLNACWVLENAPACYFKFPKPEVGGGSLWDFAATTCIFNETHAYVSDFNPDPLALNQAETTFMNKKGVLFASDREIAKRILDLNLQLNKK